MENAMLIIPGEMWGEFLFAQVGENIPIRRVDSGDEEEMFMW